MDSKENNVHWIHRIREKYFSVSARYTLRIFWAYKDLFRAHFPPVFYGYARLFGRSQEKAAHRLRNKDCREVAFFLTIPGMWKTDYLFRAMSEDPRYHPYVVIYPYSVYKGFSEEEVSSTIRWTEAFIKEKGFEYVIPYDAERKRWLDVRKTFKPDIVFFTTPYKDIPSQYYIYHFRKSLCCYVPYGFASLELGKLNYDLVFHNLLGMYFLESEIHRQMAARNARIGANLYVSGFPGTEVYLRKDYKLKDVWKKQETVKKRLIWAPHHTIGSEDAIGISTFLLYYETMLSLAEKYKSVLQIAFKPHQLLKFKLLSLWGREKTEAYYHQWGKGENTQLEEAGYVDLFLTSDGMIHDCGSFTTEYLFTQKPVMYLQRPEESAPSFNDFGRMSFAQHYIGRSVKDIENFIDDVVLNGNDPMKESRQQFYEEYLYPKDGLMPSEKIIRLIEEKIYNS